MPRRTARMLPRHQLVPNPALAIATHQHKRQALHGVDTRRNALGNRNRVPKAARRASAAAIARCRQRDPASFVKRSQRLHAARLLRPAKRIVKSEHLAHPTPERGTTGETLRSHQHTDADLARSAGNACQNAVLLVHASQNAPDPGPC